MDEKKMLHLIVNYMDECMKASNQPTKHHKKKNNNKLLTTAEKFTYTHILFFFADRRFRWSRILFLTNNDNNENNALCVCIHSDADGGNGNNQQLRLPVSNTLRIA